jgi:phosphoenolpyruvate carboxylase
LTLRVPNPEVEKSEGKILLEMLESIPRSFDVAKIFYGDDIAPIFEVTIPMVTSYKTLLRAAEYYEQFVVGKKDAVLVKHDIRLSDWIGDFKPSEVRIIPLIEDMERMLRCDEIVGRFVLEEKIEDYQRVWLARSDPALNYGSVATVLLEKIALQKLFNLQERLSIDIFPILGCGSSPFRGNFRPDNVENCLKAYPSMQTFTIQSAFKYDYPEEVVREAINKVKARKRGRPIPIDEKRCLEIIEKLSKEYQKQIRLIAPVVNFMSKFVPKRRKRKLHIGLFGYSRKQGNIRLPRAISFCASLYSIGIPPDMLGLNVLDEKCIDKILAVYKGFENDLRDGMQFFNKDGLKILPKSLQKRLSKSINLIDFEINEEHKKATDEIIKCIKKGKTEDIEEKIENAAKLRKFLG